MAWRMGVMSPALLTSWGSLLSPKKTIKNIHSHHANLRTGPWGAGTQTEIFIWDRGKQFRNKNLVYPNCLCGSWKESGEREGHKCTTAGEGRSNWLNLFCEAWLWPWGFALVLSFNPPNSLARWTSAASSSFYKREKATPRILRYQLKVDSGLLITQVMRDFFMKDLKAF